MAEGECGWKKWWEGAGGWGVEDRADGGPSTPRMTRENVEAGEKLMAAGADVKPPLDAAACITPPTVPLGSLLLSEAEPPVLPPLLRGPLSLLLPQSSKVVSGV